MATSKSQLNFLASQIVDSAFHVHKEMGPGLVESIYTYCLIQELKSRNIGVLKEVLVPLYYKGANVPKDFRIDLLVEDEIILEIKAVETLHPVYAAQIISYLRLTGKQMGFVINFNVVLIKDGIRRYLNKF